MISPLPDYCIRLTCRSNVRGLEQALQEIEQVATSGLSLGNLHQIKHSLISPRKSGVSPDLRTGSSVEGQAL